MNPASAPVDRRPLRTRQHAWVATLTDRLVRRSVPADAISLAGLACGVLAGAALALTADRPAWRPALFLFAAALIQLRLLANLFDGMVAVTSGRQTACGELYNEVPDRLSDAAGLIGAGYAFGGSGELGYLAACLALFLAYLRAEGKVAGAHQEYCGPMAKQQRMAALTLACLAAALVPASLHERLIEAVGLGLPGLALGLILAGGLLTAVRRLRRIAAALEGKRHG